MNVPLPMTLTSHLVSVVAEADSGVMARLTGILARLDVLPLQIYVRLRQNVEGAAEPWNASLAHLEIDLYLAADAAERRDRLVGLLRAMVGVESVATSR